MRIKKFFLFVSALSFLFCGAVFAEEAQVPAQADSPPHPLTCPFVSSMPEEPIPVAAEPAVAEKPQEALTCIIEPPKEDVGAQETSISIDYKDAELSSVLRSLSYSYGLNLVATKDLKGKVSVALRNVSIEEALGAILSVNGYTFTRKGNLIYITSGPGLEGIDLTTVTLPLKYLAASEASSLLQKSVSSKGDIRTNEATNSLLVTDLPSGIEKIKEVLAKIDTPPVQVLIEAKLVDITEKDYKNLGLSYSVDYKPAAGGLIGGKNQRTATQEEVAGTQTMAGPSSSVSSGQLKITTLALKNFPANTVTIDALIQANKAHLLASPAIATLNGKEARIIIGERYPYKEQTQTTTGTTETIKFVDIGTTLRVTPQVSPEGWITMSVHPEVSSVSEKLDAGPRITTREADATIRVKDGETIVIGGLIKRQDERIKGKVPLLGHIPIVGWLFTKASTDLTSTELVVFITPRIIRSPEEAKAIEPTRRSEVAVSIEGTGERITVNQLWDEGMDLEEDEGLASRRKDEETRMSDALDRYKEIASKFPGNEKADDALYRAGSIAYTYFSDRELTKRLFLRLIEHYPDSPYCAKAKRIVKNIDAKIAKKQALSKKEEKQKQVKEQKKEFKKQLR